LLELSKVSKNKNKDKKEKKNLNYQKIIDAVNRIRPRYLNLSILVTVIVISLFGLMMVYSASWYNATIYFDNRYHFVTSQFIGFILGLIVLTVAYKTDYSIFKKYYKFIAIFGILLLALVFVPGIGVSRLGAARWIGIGGFTMQPSEIAKFTFVIFAAATLAKDDFTASRFTTVLKVVGVGGVMCGLILAEPNLSITLCLAGVMFCMLFLCGARLKHLAIVVAPALVMLPALLIAEPYRIRRLVAFVDPWATPKAEGFQLIQSLFGLGNGGLFGVGWGNSTQKYMFLPFSESDFIFSIIGEEFGLIGTLMFMFALGFLVYKIFQVGINCKDRFGKFLCFGIASVIFIQSALNIAVVTGSIPPTGLPLPFISFGGTSLAVFLGAIGIVLNVHKKNLVDK